jgi:hypothetical protein
MRGGQIVTSPDGDRWRVKRRWTNRPLPDVRRRFTSDAEDGWAAQIGLEGFLSGLDESIVLSIAMAILLVLIVLVLWPLLGIAFELVLLFLLLSSGIVGRVLLRRPWTVEAVNLDRPERSTAFGVKGWRRSGQAIEELRRAIAAGQTPLDKDAGSPDSSAIRTTEDAVQRRPARRRGV